MSNAEKRNALGPEMVNDLKVAIEALLHDSDVKIIVLQSNGPAFCAGADLAYLNKLRDFSYEENVADSRNLKDLFELISNSGKLFVSKVNGPAIAGGCGLASICDFCFATEASDFGYTESRIGFVPALVMVYLQYRVSGVHLRNLLYTGKVIKASEAQSIGLIDVVVSNDSLDSAVLDFVEMMKTKVSGSSIKYIKSMLRKIPFMNYEEALEYAAATNAEARKSEDCIRGIDAFLNKEKISW